MVCHWPHPLWEVYINTGKVLVFTKCALGEPWLPWYLGRTRFVSVFWWDRAVQSSISSACYICSCFVENLLKKVSFISFKSAVFWDYIGVKHLSQELYTNEFFIILKNDLRTSRGVFRTQLDVQDLDVQLDCECTSDTLVRENHQ